MLGLRLAWAEGHLLQHAQSGNAYFNLPRRLFLGTSLAAIAYGSETITGVFIEVKSSQWMTPTG